MKVPEVEATQDKLPEDLQPKEPAKELANDAKEAEKEAETATTEGKENDDDDEIVGALSESSEESSDDIVLDDLLSTVSTQTGEKRLHRSTISATRRANGAHVRRNPFIDKKWPLVNMNAARLLIVNFLFG